MKTQYFLNHSKLSQFVFIKNADNFVVKEVPLYEPSGEGEHLYVRLRKKELTTWDAVDILAAFLGADKREFGYAGLKDKHGMTVQTISIPARFAPTLASFGHDKIKILETKLHPNKLKIGHLKGNEFFIRLKKINHPDALKIDSVIKQIRTQGIPNYFGFQRFGNDGDNYELGKKISAGKMRMKDKKKEKFLIGAYQSYLFNNWLSRRVEQSKVIEMGTAEEVAGYLGIDKTTAKAIKSQPQFLKLYEGDVMHHYPFGKIFDAEDLAVESERFATRDIVPTGLLPGKRATLAKGFARTIEEQFDDAIGADGGRRFAWIFVDELKGKYIAEQGWYELSFFLPKGSYATTLLAEILHDNLDIKDDE